MKPYSASLRSSHHRIRYRCSR